MEHFGALVERVGANAGVFRFFWKTSRAFLEGGIIGIVTFILSYLCVIIGKKFGDKLSNKAEIIGGLILIAIGLKTFIEYLIEVF